MINWKQNNIIILEKYYVYSVMPFYVWIQSFDFQPTRLFCIVGYSRNASWLLPLGRYIYWWIIRPLGYHSFSAETVYYISSKHNKCVSYCIDKIFNIYYGGGKCNIAKSSICTCISQFLVHVIIIPILTSKLAHRYQALRQNWVEGH